MKRVSRAIIAVFMAILMGTLLPVQVFADTPDYISEVKVFAGNYDAAQAEGFTILNGDNGKPADLNADAGATGISAKGNKAVYLGYKTTKNSDEAITDLALMNMKGGYSVQEYEALMETQMKSQIIPFVDNFLTSINEYRENYNSQNTANNQRAHYLHDMLNKLVDDDTGAPLGDLLLNETKYEMGDEAYNKLTDEEKKQHADILTIIAQANGKATLLMENLIIRACDTEDNNWIDRLSQTTYDDLLDATELPPSSARKQLAKQYDDDAQTILGMWDEFREELLAYDEAKAFVDNYDGSDVEEAYDAAEALDDDATGDEAQEIAENTVEAANKEMELIKKASLVAIHDYLEGIEYNDGTMLDYFMTDTEALEDEIQLLYPLIASLTDGQKAGIEFVSLKELVIIAATEEGAYKDDALDKLEDASIYEGVDRTIYKKGGVALTSDALREKANESIAPESNTFGALSIAFMVLTGVAVAGFLASTVMFAYNKIQLARWNTMSFQFSIGARADLPSFQTLTRNTALSGKLMAGFGVAMVVLSIITVYLSYQDMKARYKVDFTPVPHYMIDEADLIGYNSKGEKVILKNQSAYYKAVECNRKKGDEYFNDIDTCADMNGCVGKQWLALYAAKNAMQDPVLANSLKVVVGNNNIPAGYTTGIHMFGSDAAFNLNSSLYDWNSSAKSVMVYFKTDDAAASATGSNFTAGTLAISGGAGIFLGAVVTALGMKVSHKRKENTTVTV